jgi:hypothetical protein
LLAEATGASLRLSRACFFLLRSFRHRLTDLEPRPIASDPNKRPRGCLVAAPKSLVEDVKRSFGRADWGGNSPVATGAFVNLELTVSA